MKHAAAIIGLALVTAASPSDAEPDCRHHGPVGMSQEMIDFLCDMQDQLPFASNERWLETDGYLFASSDKPIRRKTRYLTIMVFDREGRAITDMSRADHYATRLAKRRKCTIEDGPKPADPTAVFTLACPL